MRSFHRKVHAACALIALIGVASAVSIDAQAQNSPARYQQRGAEQRWRGERRQAALARQNQHAQAARAYAGARHQQEMAARNWNQRRFAYGAGWRAGRFAASGRVHYVSRVLAGGQVRVVRYGSSTSGTFERTIRPGLVSRTFVGGGHVLYARAYQAQAWQRFGRTFAYERYVPAVRYPRAYYAWALASWAHPFRYHWGWQVQPWYPVYGALFTPYAVYTSPDLWMTDYIIAQSLQTAYQVQGTPQAQSAAPGQNPTAAENAAPEQSAAQTQGAVPAEDAAAAPGATPADGAIPAGQPGDEAAAETDDGTPASQPQPEAQPESDPESEPQTSQLPAAPTLPPAITPQIKAQLDTEIKVQLQEQQAAAANLAAPANSAAAVNSTPAETSDTPPALKPNHVFFEVVQPLSVPSGDANRYCSLGPNDYIRRTGEMSSDDWMIPVVVELSGSADCPAGLQTRIGLNDLNAMENEQEAQVMEAMQAASKSMGANGPPSRSGEHPTLIAAGSAAPDPGALEAIRQTQ